MTSCMDAQGGNEQLDRWRFDAGDVPREVVRELMRSALSACQGAEPAHDFGHVMRVCVAAQAIGSEERARLEVVVIAALLHELFNYPKGHPESHRSGEICADKARALLESTKFSGELIEPVCEGIRVHSFSGGIVPDTLEARVLQDADRLDAIGAMGVARCFATCASMQRPFYHPDDPFCRSREPDDKQWGLDHFYRKLLRIPEGLHTATARRMAEGRTQFMVGFLEQLRREIGEEPAEVCGCD